MSGGFDSLGLCPEIIRAVEGDLGWLLPTDVQDESIPLILGGGDVMVAAETGSGKTAAFGLPLLQLVYERKLQEEEASEKKKNASNGSSSSSVTSKVTPISFRVNDEDRDITLGIESDGVTVSNETPKWSGGRLNVGIKDGKCYYEAVILNKGIIRIGYSNASANLNLGTCSQGIGFGGTGMKSNSGKFESYGEPFTKGDVIGVQFDAQNGGTVAYSKNGKYLGPAYTFPRFSGPYYPAVSCKQGLVKLNIEGPFLHMPPERLGYVPIPALDHQSCLHIARSTASSMTGGRGGNNQKGSNGNKGPTVLILEPVKDLAEQVYNCMMEYSQYLQTFLKIGILHGERVTGSHDCDILIATPIKLYDQIKRGKILVNKVKYFVLDEADRLTDKENLENIMNIFVKLPKQDTGIERLQVCFFSATLHSPEISNLAKTLCHNATWVDLKGKDSIPQTVHHLVVEVDPILVNKNQNKNQQHNQNDLYISYQDHVVLDGVHQGNSYPNKGSNNDFQNQKGMKSGGLRNESISQGIKRDKVLTLLKVIDAFKMEQVLIFCRTNLDCDNLETFLCRINEGGGGGKGRKFQGKVEKGLENKYSCCVLAGKRSMNERRENLQAFKDGDVRILICTDVAARGIDIQGLPYVINMCLPHETDVENYIHRVGRVGRAERMGLAISIVAGGGYQEKVWYHSCPSRGANCQDRRLKEQGGCCIWYNEPYVLSLIEERLALPSLTEETENSAENSRQNVSSTSSSSNNNKSTTHNEHSGTSMKKGQKRKASPLERLIASNNFALPEAIKNALGSGQYGYEKGGTQIDETVVQHLKQLSPHVSKLAKMEVQAQNIWLTMALTFGVGSKDKEGSDAMIRTPIRKTNNAIDNTFTKGKEGNLTKGQYKSHNHNKRKK